VKSVGIMKLKLLLSVTFLTGALSLSAATNELTALLQKALFEEEANRNLVAAIQAYQSLVEQFDQDRALAATAVYRLGECYRKQGNTNAAAAQYERLIRDFSDQGPLVTLSRQNLGQITSVAAVKDLPKESIAETEEVTRIQNLIRNSPDLINAPQKDGATLLEAAAGNGNLAVAKLLLENGAAVNGLARPGLTPLHYAAANGHKAVADLLLSKGASVDATNANGVTPLQLAARKGFEAMVRGLLKAGAAVNAAPNQEAILDLLGGSFRLEAGQTPIHLASRAGYIAVVDLLIANGANVNAEDGRGRTPLSYAVERQDENGIRTLLAAKSDPNAGSAALPLQVAANFAGEAMVETLLKSGAKPDLSRPVTWPVTWNRRGNQIAVSDSQNPSVTPLLLAVVARKPASVTTLIKYKADPNGTTPNGTPLLTLALSDTPTLKALLEGGANPNLRRGTDNSVLAEAVINRDPVAVELLLAHGSKTDTKTDQEGWTPLHMAVMVKEPRIVELLLEAGADPNAKARNGRTPLHMAVEQGKEDLVALLLDKKADPNALDSDGRTPLDLTKRPTGSTFSAAPFPVPATPALPLPPPGAPGTLMRPGPQTGFNVRKVEELLRQRGALDEVPRLDQIQLSRPTTRYSTALLIRDKESRNQFTLLEVLAIQFEILGRSGFEERVICRPNQMNNNSLTYPDFAHIRIRKSAADLKTWEEKPVDISALFESGDCSVDVPVAWGEVIQLPELDHSLYESWGGFSHKQLENLKKCLSRSIRISVKGETKSLELAPDINLGSSDIQIMKATPFWLKAVLRTSPLVLASSDLSRVKVTRRSSTSGQTQEWLIDCSPNSQAPDLWLKDGDLIEIPEK
jgi:ankyrin repeat protein